MAKHTPVNASSGVASLDLTEIKAGQLTVFNAIGEGRFKTVSSGRHNRQGLCAILHYKTDSSRNEARVLALLSHGGSTPHIPAVYGAQSDRSGLTLAQEFATFGSVRSVIQDPEMVSLVTPGHKLRIAAQVADAVSFLESMRVIHTDLACRNFLVFKLEDEPEMTKVKITDFMNAICLTGNANHLVKKMPQATRWCAPETIAANKWSYKTDVWSLGAAIWELFAGGVAPWTCYSKRSDVANKLRELAFSLDAPPADLGANFPAPEAGTCPPAAHGALLWCLQPDAKERPSAKELTVVFNEILKDTPKALEIAQARDLDIEVASQTLPVQTCEQGAPVPPVIVPVQTHEQRAPMPTLLIHQNNEPARPFAQPLLTTPRKESASTSGGFVMTPPTRCPSTPEEVQFAPPEGVFHTSKVPSMEEVSRKITNLVDLKASLSSPEAKNANLGNLKEFLSSPEAVCGLDAKNLIALRRKLAAAQDSKSCPSRVHGPVYDTIVPLAPLTNSWYISRGFAQ